MATANELKLNRGIPLKVKFKDKRGGVIDLTEGKQYDITRFYGARYLFCIEDDKGIILYCTLEGCRHLRGGNWEITETT